MSSADHDDPGDRPTELPLPSEPPGPVAQRAQGSRISHYRLIAKIGQGGMGVVWKAEDTVLGRIVAIKLLPADAALDEERRKMFVDEARLASQVSHAHIAQVYELGREEGLDFIVMEYVEGKALHDLAHHRRLPSDRVAAIGEQVARALERAHRAGLIHRDLKPANILVDNHGDVKVVDFGLATLFAPQTTQHSSNITQDGDALRVPSSWSIAGTLPYMSPEQLKQEPLDARSDIFSLGTVLYELTTGHLPFDGPTPRDLMEEIQAGRPTPVHTLVPKVPLELDRIIHKALAPKKQERYQTMGDLSVDLRQLGRDVEAGSSPSYDSLQLSPRPRRRLPRWLLPVAAGTLLLALSVLFLWPMVRSKIASWPSAGEVRPVVDRAVMMVVPVALDGSRAGDFRSVAFAREMSSYFAQVDDLTLRPAPGPDVPDTLSAARDGGAGFLVKSSVAPAESGERRRVQVFLEVVDTADSRVVWTSSRTGELSELAPVMAREALAQVDVVRPISYEALDDLSGGSMSGTALWTIAFEKRYTEDAVGPVEDLLQEYPDELDAHALRVYVLWLDWLREETEVRKRDLRMAIEAMNRIDPGNPYGLGVEAALRKREGAPAEAMEGYSEVLARTDLSPGFRAWMLKKRADAAQDVGQKVAALKDLEEAVALTPTQDQPYRQLAGALLALERTDEAIENARRAVELQPGDWMHQSVLGLSLHGLERFDEAIGPMQEACGITRDDQNPRAQDACSLYAAVLQDAGESGEARAAAEVAEALPDTRWGCYNLACFWAQSGEPERAVARLRIAVDEGYAATRVLDDEDLAPLRGNPEFEALLAEIRARTDTP